ncbi:MAG: hypothetical protein GX220_07965 [Treponema sp.]|nr:hypothetical protein [Treponema sp.]
MKFKKLFFVFIFFLFFFNTYAEQYKINNVKYDIYGNGIKLFRFTKTREYPLRKAVEINTKKIFNSFNDFQKYIFELEQQLQNQRVIESSSIEYTILEFNEESNIFLVDLLIKTKDSWNIFPLPYPKYDSNEGFTFKLKVKDFNFFGSMRIFNFDLNYSYAQFPGENKPDEHQIGMNFDFEIPFKTGLFDTAWTNSAGISFTLGNIMPNLVFASKIEFSLPIKFVNLKFGFEQIVTYNNDYISTDDEFYFTENFFLSIPFQVYKIKNVTPITFTPFLNVIWNWDKDIFNDNEEFVLSVSHKDLQGPVIRLGLNTAIDRINWFDNHRKGYSINIEPYTKFNFYTNLWSPGYIIDLKVFHVFGKIIGINSRFNSYQNLNDTIEVGEKLRGVLNSIVQTNSCISFNLDIPIKIIATDWEAWGFTKFKPLKFFKYLDFELQLSPFFDLLVSHNHETNRLYSLKDGWYTCGLEIIIFPEKMRSLQVRISYGFDLTTIMTEDLITQNWRPRRPTDEIFFGVGLFY